MDPFACRGLCARVSFSGIWASPGTDPRGAVAKTGLRAGRRRGVPVLGGVPWGLRPAIGPGFEARFRRGFCRRTRGDARGTRLTCTRLTPPGPHTRLLRARRALTRATCIQGTRARVARTRLPAHTSCFYTPWERRPCPLKVCLATHVSAVVRKGELVRRL